jgi:hypothetical protein
MRKLFERLPLQFRVLWRQSLLRVVDLEALSIEADIPRFLGQFAGILIMMSLIGAVSAFNSTSTNPEGWLSLAWRTEQFSIPTTMLVVGLIAVISWDATFPDRRDVMVLSPLPVAAQTILIAKVSASGALLGVALLSLNCASGLAGPLVLGMHNGGFPGVLRFAMAYWFSLVAATIFLYSSVLTVQGFTALLLPRRAFLRLSAILQLTAFGLFLGVYFLEPTLTTRAATAATENQWIMAWSPSFWFFALLNQLNGSLPPELAWLSRKAWLGLFAAVFGAVSSLFLCYLRTMKKTVEEPDLVPGARGLHWTPNFGSSLQTAIVLFSVRSLTRSRQHRVVFAFYLALVFGFALSWLRTDLSSQGPSPLTPDVLISAFMMMNLAVFGLRSVFSLPISLTANWVLRITQLCPSEKYIAATRGCLWLLAVLPVWLISAGLSLSFRPWHQVAAHLAVLAILSSIFVELSLIGFHKVPFTCSYLPGKVNIQAVFWGFLFLSLVFAIVNADFELRALYDPLRFLSIMSLLGTVGLGLWDFNHHRAKSAVLYFEELPEQVITTLGLTLAPAELVGGVHTTSELTKNGIHP